MIHKFYPYFSSKVKANFYTELGFLLTSKFQLKQSLDILKMQENSKAAVRFYNAILNKIEEGKAFYTSMLVVANFSKYEYSLIKIGTETGNLAQVIEALGKFYKEKNSFNNKVLSALAYPFLLVITAAIVLGFMLVAIVPIFENIFKQQQTSLPVLTQTIISISNIVSSYYWLIAIFFVLIVIVFKILNKNTTVNYFVSLFVFKHLPFKSFYHLQKMVFFTQSMALLSKSGVPLVTSITLIEESTSNILFQRKLHELIKDVLRGASFTEALKKSNYFQSRIGSYVKVAEETSNMDIIFEDLYDYYKEQLSVKSKVITSLIEPVITLFIGFIIALVLLAMYIPMFQLSTTLN